MLTGSPSRRSGPVGPGRADRRSRPVATSVFSCCWDRVQYWAGLHCTKFTWQLPTPYSTVGHCTARTAYRTAPASNCRSWRACDGKARLDAAKHGRHAIDRDPARLGSTRLLTVLPPPFIFFLSFFSFSLSLSFYYSLTRPPLSASLLHLHLHIYLHLHFHLHLHLHNLLSSSPPPRPSIARGRASPPLSQALPSLLV